MQAEGVQYRLRDTEQRVSLSLYFGVPQPVLHTLSLYWPYFTRGEDRIHLHKYGFIKKG